MDFNDDIFEAAATITAAVAEEADVELSKEGADKVGDFFSALYKRLCLIAEGKDEDGAKPGKFEVYRDGKEEYRFRLKACNGETIAVSEGYGKKDACIKGVESVIRSVPGAEIKEIK